MLISETIVAAATPPGVGAIGIVRLSGPLAVEIADRVYRGKRPLAESEPWRVQLGEVVDPDGDNGGRIDEVLATVFRAPRSYTGEDLVEISCHGGKYVVARIVNVLLSAGARVAEPGEFTRRAFLNGRMDLSQAEAVADLIAAKTAVGMSLGMSQLRGALSRQIDGLRQQLLDLCSSLELELDFAEEDVRFLDAETAVQRLEAIADRTRQLAGTYKRGRILREGARTVIVGKPNVGKSSLLNALLREERAIVTPFPGTTRDSLEEQLDINGVLFRLIDTAGLRSTADPVEAEGLRRTRHHLQIADLVLWVVDVDSGLDRQDLEIQGQLHELWLERKGELSVLIVANKIDRLQAGAKIDLGIDGSDGWRMVLISATELLGFRGLEEELVGSVVGTSCVEDGEILVADHRHMLALESAVEDLQRATDSLRNGLSGEFIAFDLRAALDHLGEIIGVVGVEEILDHIFSNFCIGK